jgi:membrane protease YdiL (CAAX protease family)
MMNKTQINKAAPESKVTWGPVAAVLVSIGVYFGGQLLGGVLLYTALTLLRWPERRIEEWITHATFAQFLLIVLLEAATLLLLYAFMRYRRATLAMIGLIKPRLKDAGYALLGFVLYLPFYIGFLSLLTHLIPTLDTEQEQQIGFEQAAGADLILVFLALVVLVPLAEEIVMRGFLYSGLKSKLPKLAAVLITSVLFGIAHLQLGSGEPPLWVAAIDTFLLSLVLIYLREKTGRLWAPIGLHALKNGVAFLVLFVFRVA